MASSRGKLRIRKTKWNSMRAANRIPEVALESKLTDIRRHHAAFKRDAMIEEGKLWEYLFGEDLLLKSSLTNVPEQDIMDGSVPLRRVWQSEKQAEQPYSERYRQFIIFKANVMAKLFGKNVAVTRPRYSDLYAKVADSRERNQQSYETLVATCLSRLAEAERALEALGTDQSEVYDVDDLQSELAELESRRVSRAGSRARVGHVHARPHHKRKQSRAVDAGADSRNSMSESESEAAAHGAKTTTKGNEFYGKKSRMATLPPLMTSETPRMLPKLDEARTESFHLPKI